MMPPMSGAGVEDVGVVRGGLDVGQDVVHFGYVVDRLRPGM